MNSRDRRQRREAIDAKHWPVTGPEPELLQDASSGLSKWLASQPDARLHAREAAQAIANNGKDAR